MINLTKNNNNMFYGFGSNFNEENFSKLCEILCCQSLDPIYEDDTDAEVVEEIIRRNGELFTTSEARNIVPWRMTAKTTCVAKIKYRDGEPRPANPGFADYNWIMLGPAQYMYGIYLQQQITEGKLKAEDIIDKRPGRKYVG